MIGFSYCYLEYLFTKPGTLVPSFDKELLEYNLILNAEDPSTELEIELEEPNDTYKIIVNNEESDNVIEINEGANKQVLIVIESEYTENKRTYCIYVTRLSSKVAFLEDLDVHPGKLAPPFKSQIYYYTCQIPANISSIKLFFQVPDSKCTVNINQEEPVPVYELNLGCTSFKIKVISPDENHFKKYLIDVYRREIPRYILITDRIKRIRYEDPISLSPFYCPMRIREYDIWDIMSTPSCIKIKQLNRIEHGKSVFEHKSYSMKFDQETEKRMSDVHGAIPLTYGGFSNENRLSHLGNVLNKCKEPSPFKPWKIHKRSIFPEKFELNPSWEEQYSSSKSIEEERDLKEVLEETMIEYFFYLPSSPVSNNYVFSIETNPIIKLQMMIERQVKELKLFSHNSDLHFTLAKLLEERFMIQDTLNIRSSLFHSDHENDPNIFTSKHHERINEICLKWGFAEHPAIGQQLQALKDEHKKLIASENFNEADEILNIYEWKYKEISEDGKLAMLMSDRNNSLGQAAYKYGTALYLDLNSCVKNFQVGRMLIYEGKYGEAIIRLEHALSINSVHQPSKFLLGLAQAHLKKLTEQKFEKTLEMLLDGMEIALSHFSLNATTASETRKGMKKLFGSEENFFRLENPLICRGFFALAEMLLKRESTAFIKPVHVFHTALLIATMGWVNVAPGHIMSQFEYVIIKCHDELLGLLNDENRELPTEVSVKRCEWLNAFISSTSLPISERLLEIQERVCRQLVYHEPCCEFYILNLGIVLMKKAELYPPKSTHFTENIVNAIRILRIAVDMNNQPISGLPVPYFTGAAWFKALRAKFLTKRVPKIITESLQSVENDVSIIIQEPTAKEIFEKIKTNKLKETSKKSNLQIRESQIGKTSYKNFQFVRRSTLIKIWPVSYGSLKTSYDSQASVKKKKKQRKINIYSKDILTKKPQIGDKTSLFSVNNAPPVEKKITSDMKNRVSSAGVALNPYTVYSRLTLARAYKLNHQYVDCIKCYNYVRKITNVPSMKAKINNELMDVLMETENYDQALDLISKTVINETKLTQADLIMCKKILQILIKLNLLEDERIWRYSLLLSKFEGTESIRELLVESDLTDIFESLESKNLTDDSLENTSRSTDQE